MACIDDTVGARRVNTVLSSKVKVEQMEAHWWYELAGSQDRGADLADPCPTGTVILCLGRKS